MFSSRPCGRQPSLSGADPPDLLRVAQQWAMPVGAVSVVVTHRLPLPAVSAVAAGVVSGRHRGAGAVDLAEPVVVDRVEERVVGAGAAVGAAAGIDEVVDVALHG